MTFGIPSPRPNHCATCTCTPNLPRLTEARLLMQAVEYAHALTDGEDIDGDVGGTDAEYIAQFRDQLPMALAAAGFTLVPRLERGRVIIQVRRAPITDARAQTKEGGI